MQKAVVIKQPGQLFWWPQSTYWKPQVCRRLHCSEEAGLLYTRGNSFPARCCLHNCKTQPTFIGIEFQFVLRHCGGVDLTVTEHFSWNRRWKAGHYTLLARENGGARASLCLTMKSVLLLDHYQKPLDTDVNYSYTCILVILWWGVQVCAVTTNKVLHVCTSIDS